MEFLNQNIGKYKLIRVIGEGGMATVYEGIHEKLGTKAAVKILNPILARNPQLRQRFENEANFMATLNHPNITRVLDLDEYNDVMAIVMELLDGEDLDTRIKRNGPLSPKEVKEIFLQVLEAFEYAHLQGVVHRDIKPANIFIDINNRVKILDFGIAKVFGQGIGSTQTGSQMGTPSYMSPEQVKGDKTIDHRSDIYSLGVTLYFLLNGRAPFESDSESSYEIFTKIVNEPIPKLTDFPEFDKIIEKAVEKDRNKRYQEIKEFKICLDNNEFSSEQIIPDTDRFIELENIQILIDDYDILTWNDAIKVSNINTNGWRLPQKEELELIFNHKDKIPNLSKNFYWSSSETDDSSWGLNFGYGNSGNFNKHHKFCVRFVRKR